MKRDKVSVAILIAESHAVAVRGLDFGLETLERHICIQYEAPNILSVNGLHVQLYEEVSRA